MSNPVVFTSEQKAVEAWERARKGGGPENYPPFKAWQDALRELTVPPSPLLADCIYRRCYAVQSEVYRWSVLRCDQCREEADRLVQVGDEPDYESATASLCERCLRGALTALEGHS